MNDFNDDFKEIQHTGGKYTLHIKTNENGNKIFSLSMSHSKPLPITVFCVLFALDGTPIAPIKIMGIGSQKTQNQPSGYIPIYIASDSENCFGKQCRFCGGYWRSSSINILWSTTCPYCGKQHDTIYSLTDGQLRYAKTICDLLSDAISKDTVGDFSLDMDEAAEMASKNHTRPKFYYSEQKQQTEYFCSACGEYNNILGRYGYCSNCGTYNGEQQFLKDIVQFEKILETSKNYSSCIKDIISSLDSFSRNIAIQLAARIPMTPRRKNAFSSKLFHEIETFEDLKNIFDISVFAGFTEDDKKFMNMMFCRRHIYEHKGGEADEKYIEKSKDFTVKHKQLIRETQENVERTIVLSKKMVINIMHGFHLIFSVIEQPIKLYKEKTSQKTRHSFAEGQGG